MTTLNYFTCTLGQAVEINDKAPHEFRTINEFLRHQARVIPRAPAVGFPVPSETVSDRSKWRHEVFSTIPPPPPPLPLSRYILTAH